MTQKQIEGTDIIKFIRLLGELCACGLSDKQYVFLQQSADMHPQLVNDILQKADASYEIIKDLVADGYIVSDEYPTLEELQAIAQQEEPIVKRITFPTADDLEVDTYTDEKNDLINECLTKDRVSLGEFQGLNYYSLLTSIPIVAEGDIPSNEIEDLLEMKEEEPKEGEA